MKNLSILFIAFLLMQLTSLAQAPDTMWTKTFGGIDNDEGNVIIETKDKGFVLGGETNISGSYSYVIRLNQFGDTLWTKKSRYQNNSGYVFPNLYELNSGDYVMGFTGYWSGILRINSNGDSVQYFCLSHASRTGPFLQPMCKTHHNNFVLSYHSYSPMGGHGAYFRKCDSLGNEIWSKGCDLEIQDLIQTNDSGYAFTGSEWLQAIYH